MNGELIPYQLRTDDAVTLALLFGLLLVAHAFFFLGRPFLRKLEQLPLFALRMKDLSNVNSSGPVLIFLVLNTSVTIGLLAFFFSMIYQPALFQIVLSTGVLLLGYMLIMSVFFALHGLLFRFVGWLFFESEQNRLGFLGWFYSIGLMGLLNLPALVIYVYFKLPPGTLITIVIGGVSFVIVLYFFWLKKIFSLNSYGSLLLFLYLCALEIIPMILMVLGIELINDNLISNY